VAQCNVQGECGICYGKTAELIKLMFGMVSWVGQGIILHGRTLAPPGKYGWTIVHGGREGLPLGVAAWLVHRLLWAVLIFKTDTSGTWTQIAILGVVNCLRIACFVSRLASRDMRVAIWDLCTSVSIDTFNENATPVQSITALSLEVIVPTHGRMARLSWPRWLITYRDKFFLLGLGVEP